MGAFVPTLINDGVSSADRGLGRFENYLNTITVDVDAFSCPLCTGAAGTNQIRCP
jgi:hypothetical protein